MAYKWRYGHWERLFPLRVPETSIGLLNTDGEGSPYAITWTRNYH